MPDNEEMDALRVAATAFADHQTDWRPLWIALVEPLPRLAPMDSLAGELFQAVEAWESSVGEQREANLESSRAVAARLAAK